MIEQRRHQRFDLRLPFQILRSPVGTAPAGETRNVSSSGVLFQSAEPLPVGESFEYLITLPNTAVNRPPVRLRCFGRVVREEADSSFAATMDRYEFLREPAEQN